MDRRTFLGSLAALGCQGAFLSLNAAPLSDIFNAKKSKRRGKAKFDDNLVVFISDMHVLPNSHTPGRLVQVVNDILAMNPLPRNVIGLGDLANLYGHVEDYECAKQIMQPLEDAGINLTLGMGNHDRRNNFAKVFPEKAAATLVKNRLVFRVATPRADIIVLDSLQESPDLDKWITPGAIDEEQMAWVRQTLQSSTKPVFLTAHHPLHETKLTEVIHESRACCGYIHGHDHRWYTNWPIYKWGTRAVLRTLCLPSTGYWGDIGYTTFRLEADRATATLHQSDFFFNNPVAECEEKPLQWKLNIQDNEGQKCSSSYKRPEF